MTQFAAIVLAAGKSTRMRSAIPKALHPVVGRPMITHVLGALEQAGAAKIIVVVGFGAEQIRDELGDRVEYVEQTDQRGTGHAAAVTSTALSGWDGPLIVVPGDAPLITSDAIAALLAGHGANAATMLTIEMASPTGYGRVIRDASGAVRAVIEEKDATAEQRAIREVNVSIYAFDPSFLYPALTQISTDNAQGEYYLTDTIAIADVAELPIGALSWEEPSVGFGVNTRVELAEADSMLHDRILRSHMLAGVTIIDPSNTRIEAGVRIGQDTVIQPYSLLRGVTDIGAECVIGPGARIDDAVIGDRSRIRDSWVVASEVGSDTTIGPYSNIRPNSTVGNRVKIGDFVEVKTSVVEDDVSAGHFAYLGDALVGQDSNIGAGTITCNYDGVNKHKTIIGKRVFTGSNSTLVAPVTLGDGAYIAAGSVITDDVPANALALGRARQVTKPERARDMRERIAASCKPVSSTPSAK